MAALEAVSVAFALVEMVTKFLDKIRETPTNVLNDVTEARDCLLRMEAYLKKSEAEIYEGNEGLQARVKQIQSVAYYIEDALDEYMLKVPHHSHTHLVPQLAHHACHFLPDWKASRKLHFSIAALDEKITFVQKLDAIHCPEEGGSSSSTITQQGNNWTPSHPEEDEIVGFEEAEKQLSEQFLERDSRLLAISIVGPGGSGKTSLLKNVYKSKKVQGFFDCHAWIDVSGPFELDKLLLNMLRKLEPELEDTNDLTDKLELVLRDKRFVVVLDNIGSKEDFACIARVLPNGLPGSKVIITSRNSDVGSNSVSSKYTHDLKGGIPWESAWYLLCKKVFQNSKGNCPPDLEEWAQYILKRCEGLPLAVSAVGNLLAITKPQTPLAWKNFHDSLGSDLPIISRSWELSYRDLSSNLKTCFLYFGMFPEDYSISRERLIRLWVAEGFVKPHTVKRIEAVAESYLNELVGRNLVMVSAREIDGRVKRCRVLNLVRDYIIPKAKHFITVLEANSVDNILADTSGKEIRRLSVQCNINLLRGRDLRRVRTLLVFGAFDGQTVTNSELHEVLKACKLLRVLDLQGASNLEYFPKYVKRLTLLRYLSLRETQIKTVPRSIKNLGFLESLDLKQTQVTDLPKQIDKLYNLRHLLAYRHDIKNYVTFGAVQGVEVSAGNVGALARIQKLSLIKVKKNRNIIKALGELKSLKRLGLIDLKREDGGELCSTVKKMVNLSTFDVQSTSEDEILDLDQMQSSPGPPLYLQHLYLKGRLEGVPKWVPKLRSLSKVGLKWSKLKPTKNPLKDLEALPSLMELELADYYTGKELIFKSETFQKLMILSIDKFDKLNFMKVESKAMPMLKKLTMSRCRNLKLLPVFCPGDLKSLEELLLYDMCNEFIAKLEKDGEDREAFQHVGVIESLSLGSNQQFTGYKNLSPSQWHVRS